MIVIEFASTHTVLMSICSVWVLMAIIATRVQIIFVRHYRGSTYENGGLIFLLMLFVWPKAMADVGYEVEMDFINKHFARETTSWSKGTWQRKRRYYKLKNWFFWWGSLAMCWYVLPKRMQNRGQ
jgi:hypothetical protein